MSTICLSVKRSLRQISLKIETCIFGLICPDGADKTTLMRTLVTRKEPSKWMKLFDGYDLRRKRANIREMIGYIPGEFEMLTRPKTWEFFYPRFFTPQTCQVLFILAFLFFLSVSGTVFSQPIKAMNAPRLSPNVTEEMRSPDFWVKKLKGDPDQVIMTPAQISELNMRNRKKSYEFTDEKGNKNSIVLSICDPLAIQSIPGDDIRGVMNLWRTTLENKEYFDFRHKKYDTAMKKKLIEATQADRIPDLIVPRYGILTAQSQNKIFPTDDEAWDQPGGGTTNFSISSLDVGSTVAVLHESRGGDWYFVKSSFLLGWVPATNVAFGSAAEIGDYVNAKDFIVVTSGKVPVYSDANPGCFLNDFYMGAKLKLVRKAVDGYHVLAPFRRPDGSFEAVRARVKPDAGVSVGFQPFTRRNMLKTFFNKLDDPWSNGDYKEGRNCCGTVRGVLLTFGILTLNSQVVQLHSSDHVISFPKTMTKTAKYDSIRKCEPALTFIGSDDHIALYLGEVNGRHYVIHSTGSDYKARDGTTMLLRRVNINDTELEGSSQVDNLTTFCVLKP